jgi:hypothetical protein
MDTINAIKTRKPTIPNKIDKAKLLDLAKTTMTQIDIAAQLDVTPESVSRALSRYGMQRHVNQDLQDNLHQALLGLTDKYIVELSSRSLKKTPEAILHTGIGIFVDKMAALSGHGNGVNIQINVNRPDSDAPVEINVKK